MTAEELTRRCEALFGRRGWQARLARALGRSPSTVQRWASGEIEVPAPTIAAIEFLEIVPAAFWPARWHTPTKRSGR